MIILINYYKKRIYKMGKRITQQARGKGSLTFRVRPRAYRYKISYPPLNIGGAGKIIRLINSPGHTSPLAEIEININNLMEDEISKSHQESLDINNKEEKKAEVSKFNKDKKDDKEQKIRFFVPAANGVYEGKEIYIGKRPENKPAEFGDIVKLKDVKQGTNVFNVEIFPGSGGKLLRSAGAFGIIGSRDSKAELIIKRRKIILDENCRAIIGVSAGEGRFLKPIVKAGKQYYRMKAVGRKWHRTSAVKVNAVDHPFGGGRGKRIKSKIAKRNAPPGAKVGHIRPRKTGRGKEIKLGV